MSYEAKKGMFRVKVEDGYVYKFKDNQTAPEPGRGKSWFKARVVRREFDGKGELSRKNVQDTTVFASEAEALGMAMRRCPFPWPSVDGEVKTNVYIDRLGQDLL